MPYNGSGAYTLPVNSFNPAVAATTINPTDWNTTADDLETALSTAICKDGQTTTTARIPFASGVQTDSITEVTSTNGVTIGKVNTAQGADIASPPGGTLNLTTATGQFVDVTGTNAITAITLGQGSFRWVRFTGILTLTNGASLVLPGAANITTAAGDFALFFGYASSVVRCVFYQAAAAGPVTSYTGTGAVVRATSPTLVTPTIGAATATSINGNTITTGTGTLTLGAGKTLTASNTLTLAGADGTTMTFPAASASVGYINIPQNSQSAAYTTVLADQGKHILHPAADTNARTFTIDSNANVAYPVGTAITFINETANVVTIAITSDTLVWSPSGSTGSRSLAQWGVATAVKKTTTSWVITGTGLS